MPPAMTTAAPARRHELDLNYFYSCDRAKNAKKIEPRDASRSPPIDSSSYTRGAVLKAWTGIVEKGSLPLSRTHQVAMLAVDRLQDKSVLVRKAGMQLLMTLVEYNPFMGSLDPTM